MTEEAVWREKTADVEAVELAELFVDYNRLYSVRFPGQAYLGAPAVMQAKLKVLLHDHGLPVSKRALELVFTHKQCEWIKTQHVDLLNDPKKWDKHLKPLLAVVTTRGTGKGEQSEFGARPEGKGNRRVW